MTTLSIKERKFGANVPMLSSTCLSNALSVICIVLVIVLLFAISRLPQRNDLLCLQMLERTSDGVSDVLRRQRFKLGERRRQMYRDRRFREVVENGGDGRAPDYVGIGVQRAGTSRWHSLLTEHPDVDEVVDPAGRTVKEIHWFDQPLANDIDERDSAYTGWFTSPADRVVGEFTPRYLYDLWPIDRLRVVCPDTKLIVLLREPTSRLVSAVQFYEQRGIMLDRDALRESIWRGLYGSQLEYLFDRWPQDRVFVGLYEDCCLRPEAEIARLYKFLDLDPSFVPGGLEKRVNSSASLSIGTQVLDTAKSLYEADQQKLRSILPNTDFSSWSE